MTGVYKILIVDDEPRICDSLSIILRSNGYRIDTVGSGREAIDYLTEKTYDLILTDIGLPDMNAHMIVDNILSSSPETAVIILTWRASIETAVEALKKGVYDYIKKPCDYDTLLKTITKAVKHKRLEVNLKKSETRFRRLLETAWEGILIHNKGVLMQANKQFFDMFGYDPDELAGKQIIPLTVTPESMELINKNIASDRKGTYDATGLRKDGSTFPMEIRANSMEYYGKIAGVATIRDITERKKAEQDKLKLQKELARARKMEDLGLMAGSVAHDLNNILSGIVSYPELIVMDLPKESRLRKPIETIQKSGQKAAAVVSDLSTIAGGTTNYKDVLNLNSIIDEYLLSSEYRELKARYPHIKITTKLEPALSNIHCALIHINKVLTNLVLNAAEAIEYNGDITITTRNRYIDQPLMGYNEINPGEYVMLTVTDNGIGLSPKDLGRFFEPFYTKKVMGRSGTGLGMAVVWNIVKDLDGGINAITSANGTAFQIYFHITRDKITETNRGDSIALEEITGNGEPW
ncbi:MAG: response regulator [Deltaproteobacteria bacterium]|nr:response regulator [Deltaproteobacteria bacterium]